MSSTITRRRLLTVAAAAAVLPVVPRPVLAETYPSRPVRLVVPFAAGGPTDVIGRLIGQWLSERLGQPFVIENRSGAGGTIGTEAVVRADPDGYTLLQCAAYNVVNSALYKNLNFSFTRDVVPVASMITVPLVLVAHPSLPATTIPEFIAYANANPGKINMASSGIGATPHVTGELFKMMAGVNMVHVPYRGAGPAYADLVGGHVEVMFDFIPSAVEYIRSGKLRGLGVTSTARVEALPDVRPISQFVPGYEASGWFGLGAPRNTPGEVVAAINKATNEILMDEKAKARFGDLGGTPLVGSPADFGKFIAVETEKWAKVVEFSGAKPG